VAEACGCFSSSHMICSTCGSENRAEARFCRACGSSLALTCSNGHPVSAGDHFCDTCGAPTRLPTVALAAGVAARSERRLISILFADLVGFTSFAESRDPEEVREILTSYFDRMRQSVERHGGVVEKFIGDAVMAVWGTPVTHEDDAERAVRTGFSMVDAVEQLGESLILPAGTLALRIGVLTGEAAITVGAEGQGMVAGDIVNTASRVQAMAPPGAVLVDDATRRATQAAIAYETAGAPELKGKTSPVPVWRALRVIATRRGAGRAAGLEPPFVGREAEMRLVKELFHATAQEGKARLVSVMGVAGIGKSRLSWEFEKYLDGLADTVWWHRGRCLAYGEGITFWALAEMVRMRARIAEDEGRESALEKLRETIELHVSEPSERQWVEPRLAHLLGLEERTGSERQELYSAWRVFFERMAAAHPTVMVFEDLQWADAALLDFIEHLLDWSKDHPIFVITLARPELMDRRPGWGAARRNFTSLSLEPLSGEAMGQLLSGLVPGLPPDVQGEIRDRAEGVPLYAVETVRMLLDRGLLVRENGSYRVAGDVSALEVPESLHALIAARLDGLTGGERRALLDASVLGKTFTKQGLAALTGSSPGEVETMLASLVRKEFLSMQADPRSPERGQYGFLQALVREVAYQTLSKKERKARHLAVAEYLESSWGADEDEIVEVIASHYMEAYRAAPGAPDAGEVRAKAREMLARAGERAASLAAAADAQRYFEQAMEFVDDPVTRAELAERAGMQARAAGHHEEAKRHLEDAIGLFEAQDLSHPAARVSARLAEILWTVAGHIEEGIERMERAYQVLAGEEPDEDLATLVGQLGRMHFFSGNLELAAERIEAALGMAERLWLPEVLSHALNTKSLILDARGRPEEASALLHHALDIALANDAPHAAFRAYYNLFVNDPLDAADSSERGLALARRLGNRQWEGYFLGHVASVLAHRGDWDGALDHLRLLLEVAPEGGFGLSRALGVMTWVLVNRGEFGEAERLVRLREDAKESAGVIERSDYLAGRSILALGRGELDEARRLTDEIVALSESMGTHHETIRDGLLVSLEAFLAVGDVDGAHSLLERLEHQVAPKAYAWILLSRYRARIAAARGSVDEVDALFRLSASTLRDAGPPFHLAATLLEHGEWLVSQGRGEEAAPLVDEAREIFERLKANPWLERLDTVGAQAAAV